MRKMMVFGLVLVLAAHGLFAGGISAANKAPAPAASSPAASSPAAAPAAPKTGSITIWSAMTQTERVKSFDDLARAYEKENPGVKITIEVMPWDGLLDKIVASVMAKNPPEIALHGAG